MKAKRRVLLGKSDILKFVIFNFLNDEVDTFVCDHGSDAILGANIVATVRGKLCPEDECEWCESVRCRIRSRLGS